LQYATPLGRSKTAEATTGEGETKQSNHVQRILTERKKDAALDPALAKQIRTGTLYASISSRPGQSGRCDGYVLEGKELDVSRRLSLGVEHRSRSLTFSSFPPM
jgi:small subunit ribosomal protein S8e